MYRPHGIGTYVFPHVQILARCNARSLKVLTSRWAYIPPSGGFRTSRRNSSSSRGGAQNRALISVFTSTDLIRIDYARSRTTCRDVLKSPRINALTSVIGHQLSLFRPLAGSGVHFAVSSRRTTVARIINDRAVKELSRAVPALPIIKIAPTETNGGSIGRVSRGRRNQ